MPGKNPAVQLSYSMGNFLTGFWAVLFQKVPFHCQDRRGYCSELPEPTTSSKLIAVPDFTRKTLWLLHRQQLGARHREQRGLSLGGRRRLNRGKLFAVCHAMHNQRRRLALPRPAL